MADEIGEVTYTPEQHALFIEERKGLIDAARESARTFDQAILAFGSAAFAFSIAFVKDVAPHPQSYSLKWLAVAWALFSFGLLAVTLSFLFSHKACMFEIDVGFEALTNPKASRKRNPWSTAVDWCNYLSVGLLFAGILCWSVFAFENLNIGVNTMHDPKQPNPTVPDRLERGYIPPKAPPPPPPKTPPPTPVKK
jgi:hypothetical protein